jgi:hypothetical protein
LRASPFKKPASRFWSKAGGRSFEGPRELSETILEINGLRGFPFPDPPFTNSHSQLSPGLGSDENDLKISGNIKKINDLRERFAEACHPVSSWFALTLTLSPRRRNGQAPDQVVIMRVR